MQHDVTPRQVVRVACLGSSAATAGMDNPGLFLLGAQATPHRSHQLQSRTHRVPYMKHRVVQVPQEAPGGKFSGFADLNTSLKSFEPQDAGRYGHYAWGGSLNEAPYRGVHHTEGCTKKDLCLSHIAAPDRHTVVIEIITHEIRALEI